jgi:hypothetical protein
MASEQARARYKNCIAPFTAGQIESISRVLGETSDGLTGAQIGHLLRSIEVDDSLLGGTKWKRIHDALVDFQNKHQVGNHIVMFITRAMEPAKHTSEPGRFQRWRITLNRTLAFSGM